MKTLSPDYSQALCCGAASASDGGVILPRRSSTYLSDTPGAVSLVFLAITGISGTSRRGLCIIRARFFFMGMLLVLGLAGASVGLPEPMPGSRAGTAEIFDVEVEANRQWGVIPFDISFTVVATQGSDSILSVAWDFESDGTIDGYGIEAFHTFDQAIDYQVSAEVVTAQSGTLLKTTSISGYHALMTLAFDDGHISDCTDALPLMESKGVTGTAYIVPTWIGGYWYMTWDQVQALHEAGWDIGSHSMTHVNLTQVDDSTLHSELSQSRIELQSRGLRAEHFAVPNSAYNEHVLDAIRLYYESNHVANGLNPSAEDADPYELYAFSSQPYLPFEHYQALIDSVIATRGWYILLNHKIAPDCYDALWCIRTQTLSDVIDYALQNRVNIVTVDDALGSVSDNAAGVKTRRAECEDVLISIVSFENGLSPSGGELKVVYSLLAPMPLEVAVYDILGRRVRCLLNASLSGGEHSVCWLGLNDYGDPVGSGTYFLAFRTAGAVVASWKLTLIR